MDFGSTPRNSDGTFTVGILREAIKQVPSVKYALGIAPIAAEARDCTIGMNQSQFQKATSAMSSISGTPIQAKRREVRRLRMASETADRLPGSAIFIRQEIPGLRRSVKKNLVFVPANPATTRSSWLGYASGSNKSRSVAGWRSFISGVGYAVRKTSRVGQTVACKMCPPRAVPSEGITTAWM